MKFYTKSSGVLDITKQNDLDRLKIEDLIDSCKSIKRFCGQVNWSVYHHSILVGHLAILNGEKSNKGILACYLHDLSEGLFGDMQAPLRNSLKPHTLLYENCHDIINREISKRFKLEKKYNSSWTEFYDGVDVRFYDTLAFWIEYYYFIVGQPNTCEDDFNIPHDYMDTISSVFENMKTFPSDSLYEKIKYYIEVKVKKYNLKDCITQFDCDRTLSVEKLIEKLKKFDSKTPIIISDGYEFKFYSKNLNKMTVEQIEVDGETYIELAIGGLQDSED